MGKREQGRASVLTDKGKLVSWIVAFGISLSLLAVDHRGVQTGDHVFQWLGWPAWSDGEGHGLHISVVCVFVLFLMSGYGLYRHIKKHYNKPRRKIILPAIGYLFLFPYLSFWLLLAVHWNTSGVAAVDYSNKSTCNMQATNETVTYNCQITLINYSSDAQQVEVKPLVNADFESRSNVGEQSLRLAPQSKSRYYLSFESDPTESRLSGFSSRIGVQFRQGDDLKQVKWY
jgi:hypothetical protein